MPEQTRIVTPSSTDRCVQLANGQILQVPSGWELLPPGDAALTRRVKAGGPTWTVQKKKGRKTFSLGVWAPADRIATIRAVLEKERSTDAYAKRRKADAARRERKQKEYVDTYEGRLIDTKGEKARYVRLYTNGNTSNELNHYIEVEVYGKPAG